MEKLYLQELTAPELQARLAAGNDRVILPVASVEMHGPHLPMGTDAFIGEGVAVTLARRTNSLILPSFCYTWSGFTAGFPGTVSIDPARVYDHLRDVCLGVLAADLRRIVLLSVHGGNRYYVPQLARRFFEETGVPILELDIFSLMKEETAELFPGPWLDGWEASLFLACVDVLGKSGLFPESSVAYDAPEVGGLPPSFGKLRSYGTVGMYAQKLEQHVGPTSKVSREKAHVWLRLLAEKSANVFDDLAAWIKDSASLTSRGPLEKGVGSLFYGKNTKGA